MKAIRMFLVAFVVFRNGAISAISNQ